MTVVAEFVAVGPVSAGSKGGGVAAGVAASGAGGDITYEQPDDPRAGGWERPRLRPPELRLLGLLVETEALSTGQVQRLTGSPERTVQHRLAGLAGRGLVGWVRPLVRRGTSPTLWWATPFGAQAISGHGPVSVPAGDDLDLDGGPCGVDRGLARVWLVVAMNELRLGLRDLHSPGGLRLLSWQRTKGGLWVDGARRLATGARFTVRVGRSGIAGGLVLLDTGRLPRTRLVGPLSVFARLTGTRPWPMVGPGTGGVPWLLVLTREPGRAVGWLAAAEQIRLDPPGRLDPRLARAAAARVAVCTSASPSSDVLVGPWQRTGTGRPARLGDLLRAGISCRDADGAGR